MNDSINHPAHYTVYPVEPIEITRYLGFCLGNTTKYVLRAPYKGGVEDCQKALRYLELEKEIPQSMLPTPLYDNICKKIKILHHFFQSSQGDLLWKDIAFRSSDFIKNLYYYLSYPSDNIFKNMCSAVSELRGILEKRDAHGEMYKGMSGLPHREENHA